MTLNALPSAGPEGDSPAAYTRTSESCALPRTAQTTLTFTYRYEPSTFTEAEPLALCVLPFASTAHALRFLLPSTW